jgi:hypothetical protein
MIDLFACSAGLLPEPAGQFHSFIEAALFVPRFWLWARLL